LICDFAATQTGNQRFSETQPGGINRWCLTPGQKLHEHPIPEFDIGESEKWPGRGSKVEATSHDASNMFHIRTFCRS
jgi:hypothetical protein